MSYKDLITTETGDIDFVNGDFKVDESDAQHVEHIVLTDKGQFRQFPLIGVGIGRLLNGSPNPIEIQQQIKINLEADDYNVRDVSFDLSTELDLKIDCERKNIL